MYRTTGLGRVRVGRSTSFFLQKLMTVSGHRDSVSAGASASCGLFSSTAHTCVECVRALSLRTPLHHSGGLLARHPFPLSPEQLAPSW